jgi:hypothetical protein
MNLGFFTGCCFCTLDVYVHLHILFIIQDWYVDVLFPDSKTNQLCQLAYDLFVSFNASFFMVDMFLFQSHLTHCSHAPNLVCRMVARYAPPISYNFLNLIRLGGNAKTTFEKVIIVFFVVLCCLWYKKTRPAGGNTAPRHYIKKKTSHRLRKPLPHPYTRHRSPYENDRDRGRVLDLCFGVG